MSASLLTLPQWIGLKFLWLAVVLFSPGSEGQPRDNSFGELSKDIVSAIQLKHKPAWNHLEDVVKTAGPQPQSS